MWSWGLSQSVDWIRTQVDGTKEARGCDGAEAMVCRSDVEDDKVDAGTEPRLML